MLIQATIRLEVEPGSNRIVDCDKVDCANSLALTMDTTRQFGTSASQSVHEAYDRTMESTRKQTNKNSHMITCETCKLQ